MPFGKLSTRTHSVRTLGASFGAGLILSHLSPVQRHVFYQGGFAFYRLFVLLRGLDERVVEKAQGFVHPSFELQVPDDIRQSFLIRVPRTQTWSAASTYKARGPGPWRPGGFLGCLAYPWRASSICCITTSSITALFPAGSAHTRYAGRRFLEATNLQASLLVPTPRAPNRRPGSESAR